jgi:uncharacterized protein (TIGR03067 family)
MKRQPLFLALGLVLLVGTFGCGDRAKSPGTTPDDNRPNPTSELDGTWQAVRQEGEDGTSDNVGASMMRLTIAGEKFKNSTDFGDIDGFITTDPTKNPKTFDAGGTNTSLAPGNHTVKLDWSGIYEIEGDTLKLCFRGSKDERPKEFKSNPAALLVLKRVK